MYIFKVSNFRLLSPNPYFQSVLFCRAQIGIFSEWSCIVKLVIKLFFKDLRHLWNDCLICATIFNYHRSDTLLGLRNSVEHHRCHRLYKWIHELFNINPQHCLLGNIETIWVKVRVVQYVISSYLIPPPTIICYKLFISYQF